ncbi:MAG: hypothetical protein OEZ23_03720, partial [Gammaproteobacteria bacterium]|nr:hypothetical protein [Gammaproteobacteria bacterium]
MNKIILAVMLTIFSVTSANAASSRANTVSNDEFYMGVGLGSNSASGWDDASGYQIFGGYNLSVKGWNAQHSVEFGYMDSGDFEYSILGLN